MNPAGQVPAVILDDGRPLAQRGRPAGRRQRGEVGQRTEHRFCQTSVEIEISHFKNAQTN